MKTAACVLTLGVGQEAVERRDVAWARGDSEGVVLREAVSLGNTCTPREMIESGICTSTDIVHCELRGRRPLSMLSNVRRQEALQNNEDDVKRQNVIGA